MIYIVAIYLVWCGVLFFGQNAMMFPAALTGPPTAGPWRDDAVVLRRDLGDGRQVTAWLMPAPGSQGNAAVGDAPLPGAPLLVFCHGNAELIDHQRGIVDGYHALGLSVLLVEYRGYGHSAGKPRQATLTDDGRYFVEQVIARDDIDAARVVYHGRSVGGAIAVQYARLRKPAAIITESTLTHTGAFAWRYGIPPLPGLVRNPFHSLDALPALGCPVLLFHGGADGIIPPSHAHKLHAATPGSTLVIYPDAGHNDFPGTDNQEDYWARIRAFLTDAGVLHDAQSMP